MFIAEVNSANRNYLNNLQQDKIEKNHRNHRSCIHPLTTNKEVLPWWRPGLPVKRVAEALRFPFCFK